MVDNKGAERYNYSMKNYFFDKTKIFHLLKAMYILIILCALSLLRLALLRNDAGYGFVNEEYLRPICDDILIYGFILTCLGVVFAEGCWLCAKWWIRIHCLYEYSPFLWINSCQPLFRKNFRFYTLYFRQLLNNPRVFSTFPRGDLLKSGKLLRKIRSF